ncbi:hypothetical protein [Dethiothermospora halolimnae]|uniref:hypothetical protein n=1 Tax=Dethiothermospora halolimnae TaxID=3114390 RepID=UPI003CCBA53A
MDILISLNFAIFIFLSLIINSRVIEKKSVIWFCIILATISSFFVAFSFMLIAGS